MQRHKSDRREHGRTSFLIVGRVFKNEVAGNETGEIGMAHHVCSAEELGLCLIG